MKESTILTTDRQTNFDLLRIISSFAVVLIHVNYLYFQNYADCPSNNVLYIVESAINIITRFSVPAFVMISGGFNLNNIRNGNTAEFYQKCSWKIFIPCFGAISLFFLFDVGVAIIRGKSIITSIKGILTGGYYNLWFIYMLAGLYLLTPLIVKMKQVISKKCYVIASIVLIIWAIISQAASSQRAAYAIGVVFAFLGYYILGDVILNNKIQPKFSKGYYFAIALIMFLITFIVRYFGMSYYLFDAYTNFFSPTIVIASICIFAGFKQIKVNKDLSWLSGKTFYIYVFHTITYKIIYSILGHVEGYKELIAITIITLITFAVSLGISVIYDSLWKSRTNWQKKWYSLRIWNGIEHLA